MDEVAWGLGLSRGVRHEVPVDAVLQFATEGLAQERFEAVQPMRIIGQPEFADFREIVECGLGYMNCVIKSDHMGFTIHPQH